MERVESGKRVQFVLSDIQIEKLAELAAANAGKNNSLMVRELIDLVWEKYNTLGLHPPKKDIALAGAQSGGASQMTHARN
jgi:hypothetical protein